MHRGTDRVTLSEERDKCIEGKCTEGKCTEGKSTEGKCTEDNLYSAAL